MSEELDRLRAENSALRTILAKSDLPCVYCGKENIAECALGFPGCSRADDIICGEDEAFRRVVDERNRLRAEVAAAYRRGVEDAAKVVAKRLSRALDIADDDHAMAEARGAAKREAALIFDTDLEDAIRALAVEEKT